jgi:hypothetical protein
LIRPFVSFAFHSLDHVTYHLCPKLFFQPRFALVQAAESVDAFLVLAAHFHVLGRAGRGLLFFRELVGFVSVVFFYTVIFALRGTRGTMRRCILRVFVNMARFDVERGCGGDVRWIAGGRA